jgi:hypothetical protein
MSERFTEVSDGAGGVFLVRGRVSRREAIQQFREHYRRQLNESAQALSTPYEKLEVVTYIGCMSRRKPEPVIE